MRKPRTTSRGFLHTACWLLLIAQCFPFHSNSAHALETLTGRRIMEEGIHRHDLSPYIFEGLTMVLTDEAGNRDVRKMRRFSRMEKDGTVKSLFVFDNPAEINGVALLAILGPNAHEENSIYLPAFGKELKANAGEGRNNPFLGTDFAVEDLAAEALPNFRYMRKEDQKILETTYFVIDALPMSEEVERFTGCSLRRHFIQQDNFFIVRTDYFDRSGRLFKRRTCHDLKKLYGGLWRANMILMEDFKKRHKTLIKINHRIFSDDYVPPEMFTSAWLLENRHMENIKKKQRH